MNQSWKVQDKYKQEIIKELSLLNSDQVEQRTSLALKAFQDQKSTSQEQRSHWLEDLYSALEKDADRFIDLIIKEAGKPRSYAKAELERSLSTIKWGAQEALRLGGEVVPLNYGKGVGKEAITKCFPLGVILGISPFNFPLNLALHKIIPALASGNAVLIKPSPFTPLCLLALEELCLQVGIPKGLFQVLLCGNEESEKLVKDERIKMLSFTGSPSIGWMLKEKAGKKKVTLELGGNAATYIDETADLEKAASLVAMGSYLYAGQICISTQRIFVHQKVRSSFEKLLIEQIKNLEVGDPNDEKVSVGPIISKEHFDRIHDWVAEALQGGAKNLLGDVKDESDHNLIHPILLTQTQKGMKVVDEEVFGPVAILESVTSFEEGMEKINDSRFGLQAGVFSQKVDHLKSAFDALEVGGVMFNNIPGFRVDSMPYGGIKDSGLGREGLKYAMEDMTESRLLVF